MSLKKEKISKILKLISPLSGSLLSLRTTSKPTKKTLQKSVTYTAELKIAL